MSRERSISDLEKFQNGKYKKLNDIPSNMGLNYYCGIVSYGLVNDFDYKKMNLNLDKHSFFEDENGSLYHIRLDDIVFGYEVRIAQFVKQCD